jgi:hypothetical protein
MAFGLLLAAGTAASAEDGTLRVRESALNDFAAAAQPLRISRNWTFTVWVWVPNPFLFFIPTPVPIPYTCNANASVTGLTFDITPASTTARGVVTGTVCGAAYSSLLSTTVSVSLDPGGRALSIRPGVMRMTPTVAVPALGSITAPFAVNAAPTLTVLSIPLDAAPLEVETAAGPRRLVMIGRNLQLSRQDGFFEIKGDVFFR